VGIHIGRANFLEVTFNNEVSFFGLFGKQKIFEISKDVKFIEIQEYPFLYFSKSG
jgi:hypothetical protein